MLDRDLIRNHPDVIRAGASRKHLSAPVDEFLAVDAEWRQLTTALQTNQAEMNRISKSIGALMGQGKKDEAEAAKATTKALKDEIQAAEGTVRELEHRLRDIELQMPNMPHESTPDGETDADNVPIKVWGEPKEFDFEPKPHWDIAEALSLVDLPRGVKIAGSGFVLYTGMGARLQRALFNFMIDLQSSRGYHEVYPPYIANRASLIGTGNLPKFEEDLYKVDDDAYLIPTAEVPITNVYRDEILDGDALPIRLAGYSGCFRREAGAAGKDTRGLQRLHQFDKVEMVKFCRPEDSYDELERMLEDGEAVLQALGLHYRVVAVCAGDMGAKGAKQYDLEAWSPALKKWLEVSSISNFEAYQSRRANIRFRREVGTKPEFVHILNGSALGIPRTYATILETYQQADGSVKVPEMLERYVGSNVLSS
jgi:seryl-tRNA synthetase